MEKPFGPLEEFYTETPHGFSRIEQAKSNPNVLVKEIVHILDEGQDGLDSRYSLEDFRREVIEPVDIARRQGLSKFIPPTQAVWGKNEFGKESGFLITKKVDGQRIEEVEFLESQLAKELDELLAKSLDITATTLLSDGAIVSPDIKYTDLKGPGIDNVMIGKIEGSDQEHVYLVDLYPMKGRRGFFGNTDLDAERVSWGKIIDRLSSIAEGYEFPLLQGALGGYLEAIKTWRLQHKK